ncbi:hypothetical protein E4U17_006548 [Claviceps sp. LM77 group G4]|nr:hypothetical protein E4U17_006548 [Claviceps sp. LM77 group G4]KAG6061657.1 hypothetical protein E4U33_006648 [Claviceps sp. LM78 group G4]
MNQRPFQRTQLAGHFLSGLGSGVASAVILQPLDLLKTRVQQSGRSSFSACWTDILRSRQFPRSLWRGTVPSTLRTGLGSAIYLTSLNGIRQYLQQAGTRNASSALPMLTSWQNLASGAAARTFAGLVLMPLTVIKVRFESNLYTYPSMVCAAADIKRHAGLRGFFSGSGATAFRDAPYAGMYVLFYELLKTKLGALATSTSSNFDHDVHQMTTSVANSVNFVSGMFAGAACSAISNPFDAVKTRIQLQPRQYRNVGQAGYKMIAEDGFWSLWDGLALRMSRKALSSALAWTVYEQLIRRLNAA